jgi:3',5'-cyclic AMP phosphodiesterase CpdA
MQFVCEPSVAVKISKMQERVCWQHPLIVAKDINQTQLVLEDGQRDTPEFSFLVIGDSGTGQYRGDSPQRRVMEQLLAHGTGSHFVLHTGDVVYLVGSNEQYFDNFIAPYREWLVNGEHPQNITYSQMVFKFPLLPVLGNHDYYDLPWIWGLLAQTTLPLRSLFQRQIDLDIGWHGSNKGDVYARAFLDYLQGLSEAELNRHLDTHYTAQLSTKPCLRYQPGIFTRLPNRYYQFRRGGIDFFALDSNTLNTPQPLPNTEAGNRRRQQLLAERQDLMHRKMQALKVGVGWKEQVSEGDEEETKDAYTKVEQIEEQLLDIDKQLGNRPESTLDLEQLTWLKHQLIASWLSTDVRGRILFFHHPPYVTEASKWYQGQTLAIRQNLRWVLDGVQQAIGSLAQERPIVDLIINGHAHCLEYLTTGDTGHADSYLHWLVCGGSGFSLRRQRSEGADLTESMAGIERGVARSHLFVGRSGHGTQKHRPYSGIRIDVQAGAPPRFLIHPLIAERFKGQWHNYRLAPVAIP